VLAPPSDHGGGQYCKKRRTRRSQNSPSPVAMAITSLPVDAGPKEPLEPTDKFRGKSGVMKAFKYL
jgi:hypothetical protein